MNVEYLATKCTFGTMCATVPSPPSHSHPFFLLLPLQMIEPLSLVLVPSSQEKLGWLTHAKIFFSFSLLLFQVPKISSTKCTVGKNSIFIQLGFGPILGYKEVLVQILTLSFWVNQTFQNSFLHNSVSNDLTKTKQVQNVVGSNLKSKILQFQKSL